MTRKNSSRMSDYLRIMKSHADNVDQAGSPVPTRQLISQGKLNTIRLSLLSKENSILRGLKFRMNYIASQQSNSLLASTETVVDPSWYVDSGATNHVTFDQNNIFNPVAYGGKETVVVGNGSVLSVSHVESSYLFSVDDLLCLKNFLCF